MTRITRLLGSLIVVPIKVYQWCISPFIGSRCRFYPSCSSYAVDAISSHGPIKGSILGIKRISRCHPWSDGGYDPVPDPTDPPSSNE
ncbi:MAG: membrane protein insertion efficiency factor YidD [Proteobacteria bacterium]|nr:MAG: membrane protein insertion efficiency factor YidD [Pseudomonadota bacterium]